MLERERAAKTATRRDRSRRTAQEDYARRYVVECAGGVQLDCREVLREVWALPELRGQSCWRRELPEVAVRRSQRGVSGYADYDAHRVSLSIVRGAPREQVRELVLHEALHLAVGLRQSNAGRRSLHGPEFCAALARAAREYFGVTVANTGKAYPMDDAIVAAATLTAMKGER